MKKSRILENKIYLYLTEFFCGMAVMAVELGASRLLAPYFSSSQIVWTIIIGTIMIAMALGNVFGGRWADKNPDPARLFRRILIAAVWIALIPVLGKYVIVAITGLLVITVNTNFLIWAAFLACMVLFVFPLFLLGTVTPSLVRCTVSSLDESGRTVGKLGACNTIGSIIGTFVPTFVTIPAAGTAVTFLIFAAILLLIGSIYFISERSGKRLLAVSLVLFVLSALFGRSQSFAFWAKDLAYEGESVYNYLQVQDTERYTALSTNVMIGVQSVRMKDDSLTGMYYDYALAANVMAGMTEKGDTTGSHSVLEAEPGTVYEQPGKDFSVLILGMGTGTFAQETLDYFPGTDVKGVEIDEKITDLAHRYFSLSEEIPVETYDGRAFLNVDKNKYDVIMVDAYQDITIPFQMSSAEFFTLVKDHLKENGVMVVNMNMYTGEEGSITDYLCDTIASVFGDCMTADVSGSTNRELFAAKDPTVLLSFHEKAEQVQDERLRAVMLNVSERLEKWQAGNRIFTDDKAPVELLGMQIIDSLIRDELGYYKEVFRTEGIRGLLSL